jgi:hypothetical protein
MWAWGEKREKRIEETEETKQHKRETDSPSTCLLLLDGNKKLKKFHPAFVELTVALRGETSRTPFCSCTCLRRFFAETVSVSELLRPRRIYAEDMFDCRRSLIVPPASLLMLLLAVPWEGMEEDDCRGILRGGDDDDSDDDDAPTSETALVKAMAVLLVVVE